MSAAPDETVLQSRVPPAAAGQTLAAWLSARFRYLDLDGWCAEIDAGRVQRNGTPARSGDVLRARDLVAYRPVHREPHADLRIEVLHDEPTFAVVQKPAHLVSHADGAFVQNTFFRVLERHYRGLGAAPKLRLVHRLDRETSGLMVVAKTAAAATALQQQFTAGGVAKEYLAIVHGVVAADEFTEDGAIARSQASEIAIRRAVVPADHPGAQAARTTFVVERRLPEHTLVRAFPATGRTHQIRVHLTHRGHPLVGDKLYGRTDAEYLDYVRFVKAGGDPWWDGRLQAGRQLLHAAALRFAHPETGAPAEFAAPLPDDMAQFVRDRS
ncbi:MAG: RluA family pseudouridine synthase [Planctomycetota bacterium]